MSALLQPFYLRLFHQAQWHVIATALSFFALGLSTAAWAPLIPLVQQHLQISHAQFGVLLLGAGVGSMIAMPIAGRLAHRFGCKPVIASLLIAFMLILPSLAFSPHVVALAIALVAFGACAGALGVSVNLQAVQVETQQAKTLMSMFHGVCSLGGLTGVLLMSTLLSMGLSVVLSVLLVCSLLFIIFLLAVPFCLTQHSDETQQKQSTAQKQRPSFAILCVGVICFIAFLSEGAAMDWSGIYLTEQFKVQATQAGFAYTCFAALMVIGRFAGHWIVQQIGENTTILLSAICAGIGLMIVVFAPAWYVVLMGYALLGLGSANIVPLMFSRAGRQQQLPKHIALSYVSVFAYSGSLLGPALVGFGGQLMGLDHVFFIVAIALILISVFNQWSVSKDMVLETETPA